MFLVGPRLFKMFTTVLTMQTGRPKVVTSAQPVKGRRNVAYTASFVLRTPSASIQNLVPLVGWIRVQGAVRLP